MSTSIPVNVKTKLILKDKKLKLEKKLNQELTWDEFFNKIEIKINDTKKRMGKK